jgi:hypothetical protein
MFENACSWQGCLSDPLSFVRYFEITSICLHKARRAQIRNPRGIQLNSLRIEIEKLPDLIEGVLAGTSESKAMLRGF